jgi:antitoxin MazE
MASMNIKVRKIGNGYGVILPKQILESLALEEGSMVEVEKVEGTLRMTPVDSEFTRQVEAFLSTEPLHRNTYRELAK